LMVHNNYTSDDELCEPAEVLRDCS